MSTHFGKPSTPVMFSESAIGQRLLNKPLCAKITIVRNLQFFHLAIRIFFICFKSRLHQIMRAKFMPPKRSCLQLEDLALITRFDAFLKHPIIFVQLY